MLGASQLQNLSYPEFCTYVSSVTDYADLVELIAREPSLRERITNCVRAILSNRLSNRLAINWEVLFNFIELEQSRVAFPATAQQLLHLAYHPKLRALELIIDASPLQLFPTIVGFVNEYQSGKYTLRGVPVQNNRNIDRLFLRIFMPNPQFQNGIRVRNSDLFEWDQVSLTLSLADFSFLLRPELRSFWNALSPFQLWLARGERIPLRTLGIRVEVYGYHVNLDPLIIVEQQQGPYEAYEAPVAAISNIFLHESENARSFNVKFSSRYNPEVAIEVARRLLYRISDRLTVPLSTPLKWRINSMPITYPFLQRFASLLPDVRSFRILYDRSIAGVYSIPSLLRIAGGRRLTLVGFPGAEPLERLPDNVIYIPFTLDAPLPDL